MAASCVQDEPTSTTIGSEMFACKYCYRTYKSKDGLSRHVKLHHRDNYDKKTLQKVAPYHVDNVHLCKQVPTIL